MSKNEISPALNKTTGPVVGEAKPFVRVEFHIESPSKNTSTIRVADCGPDITISGLKQDLCDELSIPAAQQIWTLGGRVLEDNLTLFDYDLSNIESSNTPGCEIKISVKRRH